MASASGAWAHNKLKQTRQPVTPLAYASSAPERPGFLTGCCDTSRARIGDLAIAAIDDIRRLVEVGDVRISEHGFDELESDDISVRSAVERVQAAIVVEDYPEFGKGPSVLVLQSDREEESDSCSMANSERTYTSRSFGYSVSS